MKPTTKLRDGLRQVSSWAAWLAMEAQGRVDWTEIIRATLFHFPKKNASQQPCHPLESEAGYAVKSKKKETLLETPTKGYKINNYKRNGRDKGNFGTWTFVGPVG
jgi:hypothetical protein